MTTPTTNLGLSSIQAEFTGASPIALSEYYRGAANGYVPSTQATSAVDGTPISTSGLIRMGMFRGLTRGVSLINNCITQIGDNTYYSSGAGFNFNKDGTLVYWGNASSGGPRWGNNTNGGAGLWVQCVRISGQAPSGDTLSPIPVTRTQQIQWSIAISGDSPTYVSGVWELRIADNNTMLPMLSSSRFTAFANCAP